MAPVVDFKGSAEDVLDLESCVLRPRLTNLRAAAKYLGGWHWTIHGYVLDGLIHRVTMPLLPADEPKAVQWPAAPAMLMPGAFSSVSQTQTR